MPNDVGIPDTLARLSEWERSVAVRFANGMTYREIGEVLFIAPATVRTHLSAIYQKLGVNTKIGLARLVPDQIPEDARYSASRGFSLAGGGPPTVAVLPFDNLTADERWGRLADGISADIINDLARHSHIAVIARQTMLFYKGRHGDLRSIGRELNADYVLEGSLQASDRKVRISVQLVDLGTEPAFGLTDTTIRRRPVCHSGRRYAQRDQRSGWMLRQIHELRRDAARRKPPASLGAYDSTCSASNSSTSVTRASPRRKQSGCCRRRWRLDPGFARALVATGICLWLGSMQCLWQPTASESLALFFLRRKAVSLDPDDVLCARAAGYLRAWRGDLKGAEEENSRALAIPQRHHDIGARRRMPRRGRRRSDEACELMSRRSASTQMPPVNGITPCWVARASWPDAIGRASRRFAGDLRTRLPR